MCRSARSTCSVVLAVCLAALVAAAPCLAQTEAPHLDADGERFPVGMYRIIGVPDHPAKYDFTGSKIGRIDTIYRGHPGGNEACNILTFFDHPTWHTNDQVNNPLTEWEEWTLWCRALRDSVLTPIAAYSAQEDADLKMMLGAVYKLAVSVDDQEFSPMHCDASVCYNWKDHYLEPGMERLRYYIETVCEWEKNDSPDPYFIAGWYLTDEPNLCGRDLAEYYRLVDAIRAIEDDPDNNFRRHPMYSTVYPDFEARPGGNAARGNQWVNYDGKIFSNSSSYPADTPPEKQMSFGDMVDAVRFPSQAEDGAAEGSYQDRWYYTMWEADNIIIDHYLPLDVLKDRGWPYWFTKAREDFLLYGDSRYGEEGTGPDDWKLQAVLPAHYRNDPARDPPIVDFPRHKNLHGYIRHVLDLNPDGIWFYQWTPCSPRGPYNLSAQKGYWLDPDFDWAEAIENEIEGSDQLFVGGSSTDHSYNIAHRFELADYAALQEGSLGTGTQIYFDPNGEEYVAAATMGDLDGDGDDELVVACSEPPYGVSGLYLSENPTQQGGSAGHMREYPLSWIADPSQHQITALASGDFDGDGRDDLVIAYSERSGSAYGDAHIRIVKYNDSWKSGGYLMQPGDYIELTNAVWPGPAVAGSDTVTTAMTAGDFDGNGKDELLYALSVQPDLVEHKIHFIDSIDWESSSYSYYGPVFAHCSGGPYMRDYFVPSMTTADFDGDLDESLVLSMTVLWPGGGLQSYVLLYDYGSENYDLLKHGDDSGALGSYDAGNFDMLYHDFSGDGPAEAMASGDFNGDGNDEVVVSVTRARYGVFDGNHMYFMEGPDPTDLTAVPVTAPAAYADRVIAAMAGGDLTPSDLSRR